MAVWILKVSIMKKTYILILGMALAGVVTGYSFLKPEEGLMLQQAANDEIKLPEPEYDGETSVEKALQQRRSVREFKNEALGISEVSQLLWAAQGITETRRGFRTAPSAGALYPLEVYVAIGNVKDIPEGVYVYKPHQHAISRIKNEDIRPELSDAALGQKWVEEGAMVIVLSVVYERTTQKYGDRGIRYVHMEEGHPAQNIYLQAVSLDLGTVCVGAFNDKKVKKILGMQDDAEPLCIMPVGKI